MPFPDFTKGLAEAINAYGQLPTNVNKKRRMNMDVNVDEISGFNNPGFPQPSTANTSSKQTKSKGIDLNGIGQGVMQGVEAVGDFIGEVRNVTSNKVSKALGTTAALAGFADNHVQAFRNQQRQQKLQQKSIFGTNSVLPQDNFNGSNPLMQQDDSFFLQEKGGKNTKPIIVNDPKDPRLKAYNDSLSLYNNYKKDLINRGSKNLERTFNIKDPLISELLHLYGIDKNKIKPTKIEQYNSGYSGSGTAFIPVYKKPVQPVIYQKVENKKSNNKVAYSKNIGNDITSTEYSNKYKPIYVSDKKDPRIGSYSEEGNQYLYKAPIVKRQPKIIKKSPPVKIENAQNNSENIVKKNITDVINITKRTGLPTADDIERAVRAKSEGKSLPTDLRYNRQQPLTEQELTAAKYAELMKQGGKIMNVGGAVYDAAAFGANFIPGVGPAVSMGMGLAESMFDVTGRKKDARETAFINNKLPGALSGLSSYLPQAKNGSKIIDAPHMGGVYIEYDED